MNPAAVIVINLALLFYSIGVWSERLQGQTQNLAYGFLLARDWFAIPGAPA